MQLVHDFTVPVGVDAVWGELTDIASVAGCMPGAQVTAVDGERFQGRVKVKVGPMALTYTGEGELTERDDEARRLTITAGGREARGQGTARATIDVSLTGDDDATDVHVVTDLDVTGRPAQFGRGALADIGAKLLERFADALAARLGAGSDALDDAPTGVADDVTGDIGVNGTDPGRAAPEPGSAEPGLGDVGSRGTSLAASGTDDDPLDLLELAGETIVRRAGPLVVAAVAGAVLATWLRRRG